MSIRTVVLLVAAISGSCSAAEPCSLADLTEIGGVVESPGVPDGQLTVDDIIVFFNSFSDSTGCPGTPPCSVSDVVGIGGMPAGPDGQLTVDDVIAFVNALSDGCEVANGSVDARTWAEIRQVLSTRCDNRQFSADSAFSFEFIGDPYVQGMAIYHHQDRTSYTSKVLVGTAIVDEMYFIPAGAYAVSEILPPGNDITSVRMCIATGTFAGATGTTRLVLALTEWTEVVGGSAAERTFVTILRSCADQSEAASFALALAQDVEARARASLAARSIPAPASGTNQPVVPPATQYRPGRITSPLPSGMENGLIIVEDAVFGPAATISTTIDALNAPNICISGNPAWSVLGPTVQLPWWVSWAGGYNIVGKNVTTYQVEGPPAGFPGDIWCCRVDFTVEEYVQVAWQSIYVVLQSRTFSLEKCVCCCPE